VAESVEKHLGTRTFNKRAEHLADDIVRADQQMEDHLQKSFNRRVGTLGGGTAKEPETPVTDASPVTSVDTSPAAQSLRKLLSNPNDIRQAIILSEILDRPERHW
jgi:hypothetical protein